MTQIGFWYLCRPGEHVATTAENRSDPFRLQDVVFNQGARRLETLTAPLAQLRTATFAMLTYTTQKNGIPGETIGHGSVPDPYFGPIPALYRRIAHLRQHNAPPDTPLHAVFSNGRWRNVTSKDITSALRLAAIAQFHICGVSPDDISARSLRAGGAMALLCAKVDTDIIRLVGRWRSDEMLRYLHTQAYPLMHTFASDMLMHGSFSLNPGSTVPASALPILNLVPPAA